MREKLDDNNVYFYYKDDIKNIIKGMWKLERTIIINTIKCHEQQQVSVCTISLTKIDMLGNSKEMPVIVFNLFFTVLLCGRKVTLTVCVGDFILSCLQLALLICNSHFF